MGVDVLHRLKHFGPSHRILSACGMPALILARCSYSRKPSFLTILPEGGSCKRQSQFAQYDGAKWHLSVVRNHLFAAHRLLNA